MRKSKSAQETEKSDPNYDSNLENDSLVVSEEFENYSSINENMTDGKHWIVIPLPATYSSTNWPIRVSYLINIHI